MNAGEVRWTEPLSQNRKSKNTAVSAVMAAEFTNWSTAEGIATGLRSSGWLIDEVDTKVFLRTGSTRILKTLQRLVHRSLQRSFNDAILKSCSSLTSKVLIFVKGTDVSHSTILQLKKQSVLTVCYYPDFHFDYPNLDIAVIRDVDVMITAKTFQLEWLEKLREGRPTYLVHHGYPPGIVQPNEALAEKEYEYDLAYVGNPDDHKVELLVKVASAFPDRSFVVAGNRWRAAAAGTNLEAHVLGHPVTGDFLADLHRRSRINIAVHMGQKPNGWADRVSTRTFEIPAFRGFMLHVDNAEVRELYDVPTEIDVFSGADDLIEKISFYLSRPELRRQMIELAHRRAAPNYSYHSRGVEIDALLRPLLR